MVLSMTSLSSSLTGSMGSLSSSMVSSMNSLSSSMGSIMATTGSNLFKGDQTISGSIIPAVNSSYDLGSPTNEFRHLYLSSASLYIDGTKVLGSTTQELQITTDTGQSFKILEAGSDTITLQAADGNITLATSGGGDVILDPTSGVIALKGTTTLYAGNKILSSDGNAIQIGNSVTMTGSLIVTGFIETQELRTTYISSSILYRSGSTKFGDELTDTHAFSGSVLISGSISVPDSGLVSGSSQISYSGISGVPSGIISGSAQLPSGLVSGSSQVLSGTGIWSGSAQLPSGIVSSSAQTIANLPSGTVSGSSQVLNGTTIHSGSFFNGISVVSGSVQVDVLSTTNIARLATTGSNTFTSNQIVSGAFTTTGDINVNSSGIIINRNTSGEPYLFFKKDGVNRGSIYGITGGGLRMFDQSDNQVLTMTGSMIGINDISPSKKLTVNFGTSVSDGLLVTGSQRQETRFKSSGEHSNVFIDSAHSNIFLPTLGLLRNGTSFGEVKLQRASNSDSVGSYTESEMIMGSTTTVPVSIKTNEVRRILVESGGIVNIYNQLNQRSGLRMNNGTGGSSPRITFGTEDESVPGNKSIYLDNYWMILQPHVNEGLRVRFVNGSGTQTETVRLQSTQASFYTSISSSGAISASGNLTARNFSRNIKSWAPAGGTGSYTIVTYNWADELAALASNFDSAGYYKGFIRSGNGAHYHGYHFDILVGSQGYGGNSLQYKVQNITAAHSPWAGGCGPTPFGTIDNTSFEHRNNPCAEYLELFITKLGG